MDDTYKYPVYFECRRLPGRQKTKVENHFRIRRRSGASDCGQLRSVNERTCCVAFKCQEEQQEVLRRGRHVVALDDGDLELMVRGSLEPLTSTPSQDLPATAQKSRSSTPALPPPSDEECELLQLDTYVLRYLRESPQARKELEKQLASIACSAELYPEDGRIKVRRSTRLDAVDSYGDKSWEAEVGKLLDDIQQRYTCHFEFDPHKIKALLHGGGPPRATDEVKVYSEVGMAVLVGEQAQVAARLSGVEGRPRASERRTSVCRLGEAKLRLLWKEIERSVRQDFPGVKVTQGEAGKLVLEGSVDEILKAGEWISQKEKTVIERPISDMSPGLFEFLRKAYKRPGALCDALKARDKVEAEFRNKQLHLVALLLDDLDETESALRREFKEVRIDVPSCSAVPPDLRTGLQSRADEMNRAGCRVQITFDSQRTVCFSGHAEEVEELRETVARFTFDEASVRSTAHLPFPELALQLPELLELHGCDCSGVNFLPSASSSGSTVVLEGPSERVAELQSALCLLVDSYMPDEVAADPPPFTLSEGSAEVASYSLCGGLQVLVCQGDITQQAADALVNAANAELSHCGGVSAALSRAGGPEIQQESTALVKCIGEIPTGEVVMTSGGKLKCKKLFHAVGPAGRRAGRRGGMLLEKTVHAALNLAEIMQFRSIAIPCISSGAFGVPVNVCSEAIATAVRDFGCQGERSLRRIVLIDNRDEVVSAMRKACHRLLLQGMATDSYARESEFQVDPHARDTASAAGGNMEAPRDLQSLQARGDAPQTDRVPTAKRIVLLGKTGSGKSNLANTILGEESFDVNHSFNSGTQKCQAETKRVNGRGITLIDTPGFFDSDRSEEELKPEILRCITECAPGPHAFFIVLKVEKFTELEQVVVAKICQYFTEEALKYAVVVFTHGDLLPKGMKIEKFVHENRHLSALVRKCGNRCHVIDNTLLGGNNDRANRAQVEELLDTVDKMIMGNNGGYYTNKVFQLVSTRIQIEENNMVRLSKNGPPEEIRRQAKARVFDRLLIQLAGTATGALLGAVFGLAAMVGIVISVMQQAAALTAALKNLKAVAGGGAALAAAAGGGGAAAGGGGGAAAAAAAGGGGGGAAVSAGGAVAGKVAVVAAGGMALVGAGVGGVIGYDAATQANTPWEAAEMAANAVFERGSRAFGLPEK